MEVGHAFFVDALARPCLRSARLTPRQDCQGGGDPAAGTIVRVPPGLGERTSPSCPADRPWHTRRTRNAQVKGPAMSTLAKVTAASLLAGVGLVVACGGGGSGGLNGGPGGGSAACGANGTNACPPNLQCDATLGCVACTADPQCRANRRYCLSGACVPCRSDADCGGGTTPSCWPGDHACHAACTRNQDCPRAAGICEPGGECVGCSTASDCPADAKICDSAT